MQNPCVKYKISNFELWFLVFSFQLLAVLGLCSGCDMMMDTLEFLKPAGAPDCNEAYAGYYKTELKTSSSADVLEVIYLPEYELLSQSKSVVASQGENKRGHRVWIKMVAFGENGLTAKRKYLFVEDERPKVLFTEPWESLRFDSEMVLDKEILDKPYTNKNARLIAILKQVLENIGRDIKELSSDNKTIAVSGMLINQAIEAALVKLEASPVLAAELSDEKGLGFEHTGYDKGKIKMTIADDIVTVNLMLGSCLKKYKVNFE